MHSAGKEGEEEEEGEGVSEEERVRRFLLHSAHLSLCVHGLESGLSRDVHGEVSRREGEREVGRERERERERERCEREREREKERERGARRW